MTIEKDCPLKSNVTLANVADLGELLSDLPPFTEAELAVGASLASDLSPADLKEIRHFDSPALRAVENGLERRRKERDAKSAQIAATSAKQARDDYAEKKKFETGEAVRPYMPTGIAPRHYVNGHFQFETEEEFKLRYDRERKRLKRPKFVPLTDEEKKARKRAQNAKRSRR